MQLKLVDAAHILPVGAPGSSDDVRNGIALSPTLHRAYDTGLIYLDTEYRMRLNQRKLRALRADGLHGGATDLRRCLNTDERILLPLDIAQHPNVECIMSANEYRNIRER
jgi:putative restriction endonuclease